MPDKMKMQAYSRAYMARREREGRALINEAKDRPCQDCGRSYPPHVMQLDHRPGEVKLFSVGARAGQSRDRLLAEIAKCDVVCANCHALRTHFRKSRATVEA